MICRDNKFMELSPRSTLNVCIQSAAIAPVKRKENENNNRNLRDNNF